MRICFIGDGNSVHIKRWLDYFIRRGHEVHLITFNNVKHNGVIVHRVGELNVNPNGGNFKYIKKIFTIKRIIKEIKPDIVNAHYITSYGFLLALAGFHPSAMSAWGSDILVTPKRSKLYRAVTKFALDRADIITSDSDFMSQEIEKLTKTKVITVPMGVEKELCSMERKSPEDETVLLSLRTIDSNSNIDVIIKAFNKLIRKNPSRRIRLVIGNTGPDLEKIRAMVNEMNLWDKIEIKGFIKREELLELLSSCTAYLSIPTSDSTSVTLLEAMAFGTPCIVSDLPANREWITDGENGIIVESINSSALSRSMERIIGDEVLRKRCEKVCREIILKRAIWDDNMSMVAEEYAKLAGSKENNNALL